VELVRSTISPLRALITECAPFELPLEIADHWLYDWLEARAKSVTPKTLTLSARSRVLFFVVFVLWDVFLNHFVMARL
jgi:hypothetical protein